MTILSNSFRAHLAVMTCCILWGAAYVIIHFAGTTYPPGDMAALRFISASVAMLCLYFIRTRYNTVGLHDLVGIALLSIIGFVIYNLTLNRGELVVSGGTTSLIKMMSPIIAACLAVWMHKERVTKWTYVALLLGLVGTGFVTIKDMHYHDMRIGLLFIFVSMICGMLFTVMQKPFVRRLDPIQFLACCVWFATLFTIFWWPSMWQHLRHAPLHVTAWVVFNGMGPAAVGYSLWAYGISKLPVSRVVVFLYLSPLSSIVIEWAVFGIRPDNWAFVGGAIIMISLLIVNHQRYER